MPARTIARPQQSKRQAEAPEQDRRRAMAPLAEQSPEELAVRAQAGGSMAMACFGELVTRFEARLFSFLLRRTSSRSDAEELTQEAFTRAWERIASYDPSWKFSTWLYTIATRLAVSRHRKLGRERASNGFEQACEPATDTMEAADDRRLGSRLWSLAKRELSHDQQTALWLRYAEDLSIGEIARVLGKSQVGVRVSLFRSRQTLAKAASAEGWLPTATAWRTGEAGGADAPELGEVVLVAGDFVKGGAGRGEDER